MCYFSLTGVLMIVALAALASRWFQQFARWDDAALTVMMKVLPLVTGGRMDDADVLDTDAVLAAVARSNAFIASSAPPVTTPGVKITPMTVKARDGTDLHVRHYAPTVKSADEGKKRPAVIYYHGGGWVAMCGPTFTMFDGELAEMADKLKADVFSIDYRCAPVHRFPTAAHDAIDAFCDIARRADEFHIDATKLGVAGMSAGGNLALVAALAFDSTYASTWQSARCKGVRAPKVVIAQVPVADSSHSLPSSVRRDVYGVLSLRQMLWFRQVYAPDARDVFNPLLSPLHADAAALKRMPHTLVITAGYDILRDEGRLIAERIGTEKATSLDFANMPHEGLALPGLYTNEKARAKDAQADFFAKHI